MEINRKKALEELISFSISLDEISVKLTRFNWDYVDDPLIVKPEHVILILNKFLDGIINSQELERWAGLLECRDDVDYEKDCIKEIIHKLSNSYLNGEITIESCQKLIIEMSN